MEFEKIIPVSDLAAVQGGSGLIVDANMLAAFTEQAFKRLSFTFPQ